MMTMKNAGSGKNADSGMLRNGRPAARAAFAGSTFLFVFALLLASALTGAIGCGGGRAEAEGDDAQRAHGEDLHAEHAHAQDAHAGHAHGGDAEAISDLDRPIAELIAERCEHDMLTHACDECRYETGIVKVSADLIDADGPLALAHATLLESKEGETHVGEVRLNEERSAFVCPRVEGTVHSILVDVGQVVQRGDALYTVTSAGFSEAKAAYRKARAALRLADAEQERERDLYAKKISPHKDVLEAEAAREDAAAAAQAAREQLLACGMNANEIERLALAGAETGSGNSAGGEALTVRAPFAGVVLERRLSIGANIGPGDELLLLADTSEMWIATSLYERELARVTGPRPGSGSLAYVEVPAYPGRVFEGRLDRFGGTLNESTRTLEARVIVPNPGGLLRAGMFANVRLLGTGSERVLALPAEAVLEDEGRRFVFIPLEAPYFIRRPVSTGRAWEGWVEIVDGLSAGDAVVGQGAFTLKSDVLRSKMGAGCAD